MSSFQAPGDFSLSESVGKRVMTPGGAVAPGVAPELMPVLVLENDRPENMLLSYQRMFARATTVAAGGAGTRASAQLVNNRADILVTVEFVTAQVAFFLGVLRGNLGALPVGTASFGAPRDTRITPSNVGTIIGCSTATVVTDNTLGLAGANLVYIGAANGEYRQPIVIGPGDILYLSATSDALPLTNFSLAWRERRLNQSERV